MTLCFVHSPLSFEFEGKEVLVGLGQRGEPCCRCPLLVLDMMRFSTEVALSERALRRKTPFIRSRSRMWVLVLARDNMEMALSFFIAKMET